MHIGNFSQSIPCSREALSDIYPSLPQIPQVVFNSSKKCEIARGSPVTVVPVVMMIYQIN